MTDSIVIQGVYSDFKVIKTRSVAQIIIEIPVENSDNFIAMFGIPQPAKEKWVAVALLNNLPISDEDAGKFPLTKEGEWCIRTLSALVEQRDFRDFICYPMRLPETNRFKVPTILDAVKAYVGIKSRREFRTNQEAVDIFKELYRKYSKYEIPS